MRAQVYRQIPISPGLQSTYRGHNTVNGEVRLGERRQVVTGTLTTELGDITKLHVDAIVNAANERMLGGGGVDGAIHRAAGPKLLEACKQIPEVRPGVRCPTGEARLTPGFDLPARHVIHTVGPVWRGGDSREDELLASCYRNSLDLAAKHACRSVAFPAISCGVYGYPASRASKIAVREIRQFFERPTDVSAVVLVAFDQSLLRILQEALS
jgi:O-acetyl-ADP-ribose deacetylase (regulator of RNase III)